MWISSQNGRILLNVNCIKVIENMIYGYYDKEYNIELLGEYETNERAYQVKKEILSFLTFKQSIALSDPVNIKEVLEQCFDKKELDYVSKQMHVYEMPKE